MYVPIATPDCTRHCATNEFALEYEAHFNHTTTVLQKGFSVDQLKVVSHLAGLQKNPTSIILEPAENFRTTIMLQVVLIEG